MDENKKRIRPAGTGFLFMIIACVVYLIWWFVNYYPDSPYSNFLGNTVGMVIWGSMFLAVFVLCVVGVVLIVKSFKRLTIDRSMLSTGKTAVVCLALSVLLPLLISRIRFITLDIFLIIWWVFLELCTANIMYGSHLMEKRVVKNSFIRTVIYTAIGLFLYIIYPFPPEYVRFVLGAVPIILYAVDMSWMVMKMKNARRSG